MSMLGPSPDWFIGIESLSMVDEDGLFIPEITYELYCHNLYIWVCFESIEQLRSPVSHSNKSHSYLIIGSKYWLDDGGRKVGTNCYTHSNCRGLFNEISTIM